MMLLAEISAYDPPVFIGLVLGCLAFLLWIANMAMEFWRGIKDKPTGGEVMEIARKEFQPKGHYASHEELKTLAAHTTNRHSQLFRAIEDVEKAARHELNSSVNSINDDRRRTLEKLNNEFTFIRETLSSINTELRIKREDR